MTLLRAVSPALIGIAGLVAAAMPATNARAQNRWIYTVTAPTELERDSNAAMSASSRTPVTRLRISPQVRARYKVDEDQFDLDVAALLERSSDESVSSSRFDPRLRASWRRETAATDYSLFTILEQRAYRAAEVDEQVPVGVDGTRTLRAVGGAFTHRISAKSSLSADFRQEWVDFDAGTNPDYQVFSANAQVSYATDERSNWYGVLNHQLYQPDGNALNNGDSRSSSFMLGYHRALSEALDIDLAIGAFNLSGPSAGTSVQTSVRAVYVLDRLQTTFEASRRPSPVAADRALGVTDLMRLQVLYRLDPRSNVSLEAGASRSEGIGRFRAAVYSLAYNLELAPFWTFTARFVHRQRQDSIGTATGNLIGLVLTYSNPDY